MLLYLPIEELGITTKTKNRVKIIICILSQKITHFVQFGILQIMNITKKFQRIHRYYNYIGHLFRYYKLHVKYADFTHHVIL